MNEAQVKFAELLGETLTKVVGEVGADEMLFETVSGKQFKLYHSQDCCESVRVEDIVGDLSDLIGAPILEAEDVSSSDTDPAGYKVPEWRDSYTWTFYKLRTINGGVTIRWLGESNGYYSESVDFARVA